jgi:hypothetical protein
VDLRPPSPPKDQTRTIVLMAIIGFPVFAWALYTDDRTPLYHRGFTLVIAALFPVTMLLVAIAGKQRERAESEGIRKPRNPNSTFAWATRWGFGGLVSSTITTFARRQWILGSLLLAIGITALVTHRVRAERRRRAPPPPFSV